ncbi:hypothetical protein [Gymnodinialimonas sp. 57CJ19]|uniref:hypothetical protein n=1 Tax=Gymnodinialimonas sp. 57CJ19 TaxID=3138498 RepID=UPI00313463AB
MRATLAPVRAALLALSVLAGFTALPAMGQTLHGITFGEPIPAGLPQPDDTQTQAPFTRSIWTQLNDMMVTVIADSETGGVLFMEMRPAAPGPVATQIDGLVFGETTLAELHARFGSEGVVFANVGRGGVFDDILVHFATYEIDNSDTVLSLATTEPLQTATQDSAAQAVLDSVIVADSAYLTQVWGLNRGRLPGYSPIADPFDG